MTNYSSKIVDATIGLDLGDRWSQWCELDGAGQVVGRDRVATRPEALHKQWSRRERIRFVIENGTHSRWVKNVLEQLGHEVIVANARRVRLIYGGSRKHDRLDAEKLARLGRVDVNLLSPIRYRSDEAHADRAQLQARDGLVRARTQLINQIRGMMKSAGGRLPSCSSEAFARKVKEHISVALREAIEPLLQTIEVLTDQIQQYDRRLEQLCQQRYPETGALRQVTGVGPVTSLAFLLTIEDPDRFRRSRDVGPYLGLTPRLDQSGEQDKQLRISKEGDIYLRRLLVSSAHYILGPFGPDSNLRRHGLKIAARGGKNAKKRAVVAVARKLAVLLHHLWRTGEVYEPLDSSQRTEPISAASA